MMMSESKQLDAEARMAADYDGTYKTELIETLEKHRDAIAFQRQGFLPPDEYQVVEHMAQAVDAALNFIGTYKPGKGGENEMVEDNGAPDKAFAPMINI
jgi:hypothetical protein